MSGNFLGRIPSCEGFKAMAPKAGKDEVFADFSKLVVPWKGFVGAIWGYIRYIRFRVTD